MTLPERIIADSYWVDGLLAAGEYPGAKAEDVARQRLALFEEAGIGLFLDLTHPDDLLAPYEHLLETARRSHHPIIDTWIPSEAEMTAALDAIDDVVAVGTRVYVHCWGGIGRTGTVVGCWLVRHGAEPGDAIELIRARRRGTPDYGEQPESPQTSAQHRFVRQWGAGD